LAHTNPGLRPVLLKALRKKRAATSWTSGPVEVKLRDGSTLSLPASVLGSLAVTSGDEFNVQGWLVWLAPNGEGKQLLHKGFRTKGLAAGFAAALAERDPAFLKMTAWSPSPDQKKIFFELVRNPPPAIRAPKGPKVPKRKTYRQAQDDIMDYLESQGWALRDGLKVPHATAPDGRCRVYFKAQAVYFAEDLGSIGRPLPGNLAFKYARSMWVDVRKLDGPGFVREVNRWLKVIAGDDPPYRVPQY